MLEDKELKDRADKMELPLKEGAWEFVEAQIPSFPTRKKNIFLWKYFGAGLVLATILVSLYFESRPSNSENQSFSAKKMNLKLLLPQIANPSGMKDDHLSLSSSAPEQNKMSTNANMAHTSRMYISKGSSFAAIKESKKKIFGNDSKAFLSHNLVDNQSTLINVNQINDEETYGHFLMLAQIKRYFNQFAFELKTVPLLQPKKKSYHYYLGVNYAILNTNIHLEPELMKLPKGRGNEFSFYAGVASRKWKFAIGTHVAQFKQTTSMGDQHDTTYLQVFRPNFETALPSQYVERLHDTSSLYLAGTSHNKVNQEFKVLGLSLNVSRTLFHKKKLALDLSYGANYKLLTKANTFFYDNINKAAVPFTQMDKGIVFKHLMSSRARIVLNYKVSRSVAIELAPFVDYFHKPFIKHYYKADLLNYGLSLGLNYTFK